MTNPAEEVVRDWLVFCRKQFVMMNIPYQSLDKKGKTITREMDILATDGLRRFADYEVKWRTTDWINATPQERIPSIIHQITNMERQHRIREIIEEGFGIKSNYSIQSILVTPRKHFGVRVIDSRIAKVNLAGIQIVWFEQVVEELLNHIKKRADKGQLDSVSMGVLSIANHLR